MNLIETKVLVALLFGIIRFTFGILPIQVCSFLISKDDGIRKLTHSRRRILDTGVAKMQSFGGGVLFATCLLHMMPEVHYSIRDLQERGILTGNYPYSQLVVSLGFLLIYFLEEVCHYIVTRTPQEPCRKKINGAIVPIEKDVESLVESTQSDIRVKELDVDQELNVEFEIIIEAKVRTRQQIIRAIFVVIGLSFHAIFEGMAIGLQHSTKNIWYLFTAISVHSATVLFCMGLEIVLAGIRRSTIVLHMAFLAFTSPLGVVFGLVASMNDSVAKSFAIVLLEGISTGTILYITFFEILIREKERRACRIKRAVYIVGGFSLMAGLVCIKVA